MDAVSGIPRGKLALRRLKAVAAVEGVLQQRGNVLRRLLLLERGGSDAERLRMLDRKRNAALDEIHFRERQLEKLDYLRHELRKAAGTQTSDLERGKKL